MASCKNVINSAHGATQPKTDDVLQIRVQFALPVPVGENRVLLNKPSTNYFMPRTRQQDKANQNAQTLQTFKCMCSALGHQHCF